jgi:hypothetical protein
VIIDLHHIRHVFSPLNSTQLPVQVLSIAMLSVSINLSQQWVSPSEILAVLLLIGGNIIQMALAQLSGSPIVPVAFSFGWASYAFSALLSAVGDRKLMPSPEFASIIVDAQSGDIRPNNSWVLGRILRDMEMKVVQRIGWTLWVHVYVAIDPKLKQRGPHGLVRTLIRDWVWTMGVVTIFVQLAISVIPWALHGNWSIFLVTLAGTAMSLICGAIPQWKTEKWACRGNSKRTVALTRGNGSRLVAVIIGNGVGPNLGDLAIGRVILGKGTRSIIALLAVLWLALLCTVPAVKDDTWYLMGIGLFGMIQNVAAAGATRAPEDFNIPLEFCGEFSEHSVMATLQKLEIEYPGVGAALLRVFFPFELRPHEVEWWDKTKETKANRKLEQTGKQLTQDLAVEKAIPEDDKLQRPGDNQRNGNTPPAEVLA